MACAVRYCNGENLTDAGIYSLVYFFEKQRSTAAVFAPNHSLMELFLLNFDHDLLYAIPLPPQLKLATPTPAPLTPASAL